MVLSFLLSPLWAQQEVVSVPDSLVGMQPVVPDTIIDDVPLDTLSPQATDTLEVQQPLPEFAARALMQAWQKVCPITRPSAAQLRAAEADSLQPSALRLAVDTLPVNPALSYAQADLRMPLVLDAQVPDSRPVSLADMADDGTSDVGTACLGLTNPFRQQLDYAAMRRQAVYRHSLSHLGSVSRIRSGHYDLPTERRQIERQELSGEEQIDTSLPLELETASLNVEQVSFHADKWHRKGTTDLQISQTALSDNWYKGGDNNMTISNYDKLAFSRYDESKKTTLDITLELRLSGYYTKADTIHPMRVNDNQFRADVSYGYKAWKNWYYSTSAYIKTPVFEYFNANSKTVKSNFFAPLEFNVAVGMDLKLTSNKKCTYSLMLAPLSYNLKYVADDRVSVTSYGIKANHCSLNQIGASVTSKLEWTINESVSWSSRGYFFTSYHNVQLEFENTFNVKLGRYSTAKIYLYPRFDDSVDDKIQMKEMLTFGLAFSW